MTKRILITGSSGHSGGQIAQLLKANYDIIGIDLVPGPHTTLVGSLGDEGFIKQATRGVDTIIHTASLHAPHISTHSRQEFIDTNITGTLRLLEAAASNGVKKLIYTSTTSLYGASMQDVQRAVWVTEELASIPRDIYDITKIAAEGLCRDFFDPSGLQTCVLRVSRFWNEPLVDKIFYRMYRGLDIRDVAMAHQLALEKDFSKFDIFNISAQSIFSEEDLYDLKHNTEKLLQERIPELISFYRIKAWPIPSSIDRVYVIEKAKNVLGYFPKYNISQMLQELNAS